MNKAKRKIVVGVGLIVVFLLLVIFLFTGKTGEMVHELVVPHQPDEDWAEFFDFGVEGMIGIALLSMFQVIFLFIPAEPIQVLAGLSNGFGLGVLLCLAGVIVGNTLIYGLYKLYGEKLDRFFTKRIHIDFESARHHGRIAMIVFILYFLPAIPYGIICLFASAMRMKYTRYILVTSLCSIPSICIGVGLGYVATAVSWLLSISVLLVIGVLLFVLYRNREAFFDRINQMIARDGDISKTEVQRPKGWLWRIMFGGCRVFFRSRIKIEVDNPVGKIEGPAIVLCNHGAFVDFFYAGEALLKNRPHFMTARLYFFRRDLGWLLRSLGAFPKSMFSPDFENAKNCRRVLRANGVLALMPEARLSTVGEFEDIQPDTYRFVHKAGVNVYICHFCGDYLASPKWGDGIRRGAKIEAKVFRLATAEELKGWTEEETIARVTEALSYNEFEWLKTRPELTYRKKTLAEGLENILTRCPKCGGRHTIATCGRTVSCTACGFATALDDRYGFTADAPFANFAEWYHWQVERQWEEIEVDPDFAMTTPVVLHHSSVSGKRCLRPAGEGTCTLSREGLRYVGTEDGQTVDRLFPMTSLYRVLFGAGEDFEVYDGREIWYFAPEEKRSCVDYYTASIKLKELSNAQTEALS